MKLLYKEELLSTGVKKVVKYVADDVDQPYYYRGVHDAIRCVKGSSTFYILDADRSSYVVDDFSAAVPFGFTTNRYTWDDVLDTFTINPDFDPTIFQRTVNYPVRINDVSDLALEVMGGGDFNRIRVTDSGVILGETDSINTSTGSFIVYGGVAVKKNLTIGDNLTIGGDLTVNGAVSFSTFGMNNNSPFTFKDTDGANLSFIVSASDMFSFNSTTSAGASREIFKIQANNDTAPFIIGTDTHITSTTSSSSTSTGAFVVGGGIGVGGWIFSGGASIGSPSATSAVHIVHTDTIARQAGYNWLVNSKSVNALFLDTQGTLGRLRLARYDASGSFVDSPFEMYNDTGMVYCNNGLVLEGVRSAPNPRPNLLINSNFDFWQEGTSLSSGTGYRRTSDGGFSFSIGTTCTVSRQAFTVGQTAVPNGPKYYLRHVVSSVAGASNRCIYALVSENLEVTAGKKVTFSLWLKADATKNISVEFTQVFGSGGSSGVNSIGVKKQQITPSWARYIFTADMPSISGKTIGSTPGYINAIVWFDAGSDFNSRTDSLGQQSGTFDIAQVKLEIGDYATDWEPYNLADELVKCQRYCEKSYDLDVSVGAVTSAGQKFARMTFANENFPVDLQERFRVIKAYVPTVTFYSPATGTASRVRDIAAGVDITVAATTSQSQSSTGYPVLTGAANAAGSTFIAHWKATSYL